VEARLLEEKMLTVNEIEVFYEDIQVLKGISLEVPEGKIVTVLGANGAGKTTTLRAISGVIHPRKGEIQFEGRPIKNLPPYEIVRIGVVHVPEGRELFYEMTVHENLEMGAYSRRATDKIRKDVQKIMDEFPILAERKRQSAGTLSGGEQQMLAIARGLMSCPKLILLDEPSLGLSPLYVQKLFGIIQKINQDGTTLLLVEQNARLALQLADFAFVLETGCVTLTGEAKKMASEEKVKKLYLGG
jgi:branched-chain amino acid transport system ATP-binding protein